MLTLAAVSMFLPADKELLEESFGVLQVCQYVGNDSVLVIDAKSILEVVGMVPFNPPGREQPDEYFVVEKLTTVHASVEGEDELADIDQPCD
jgi:hypothetical protein